MLFHFCKVIFRYLFRKIFFTSLNIGGLSIGLASCIVIFLFVINELSYDEFHHDREKIYRLIRESQINGMPYNIGITSAQFGPALIEDYPQEIQSVTRALAFSGLVTYQDQSFIEQKLLLADSNFFSFFSFPLLKGEVASVLRHPNSIVISLRLSHKYFGDDDPVGKVVRLDDQYDMMVTGVMDEFPGNSHLQFDAVGSINIAEEEDWFEDWWGNAFYTYVRIDRSGDADALNGSFPFFMEKYFGKDFQRVGNKIGLKLEPLGDIYFNNDTRYENNIAHGDRRYVYIFGSVGILLLLLAGINYINLATAQASVRAKEVGIRKTLGSSQATVAFQFLSESFFLCASSAVVAICLAQLAIPFLNREFDLSIPGLFNTPQLWIFLIIALVVLTVASGAYPAFLLSSFKPVKVLKGEVKGELRYVFVRKVLVVFQFAISAFMIISTLFINKQLDFMREKDHGFKADQLMVVSLNNGLINRQRLSFKEALLRDSHFKNASLTSGYPGGFYDATTVRIQGNDAPMRMRTLWTDTDYMNAMGLAMKAGRFLSGDFPADSTQSVVLNETAVRQLGWSPEEALGKRVMLAQFDSVYKEVVGVISDFHFSSLKQKIEPLIISYLDFRGNLIVSVSGKDIPGAVAALEKVWGEYQTGFPLDFQFLDEVMARLYTAEIKQGKIFATFSVISVLIACLGILGLGTYMASQRRKEIGVRKVLGATTRQVSTLLMKDLLILVLISNLIAIPAGHWAMSQWLEGFAYRIELHALIFIIGSATVLVIAFLIVGFNASRVATQNPVTSLRTE